MNKSDRFLVDYAKKHYRCDNQSPLTRFVDSHSAIDAKLIGWPDQEAIKDVFTNFAFSSWFKDFSAIADDSIKAEAAADLASGRILGQGLESCSFSFVLSGMSLHNSHAIVRTRIGACYLQQSQAVKDFRHSAVLIPPALHKVEGLVDQFMKSALDGKLGYARAMDSGIIAIDDARSFLPKTIPVWINCTFSLPSLLQIYSKRTDTQEEAIVFNILFEKVRNLVVAKFPYLDSLFVRDSKCIHTQAGYRSNCIYKRDANHGDHVDEFTLHSMTRDEMVVAPKLKDVFYSGRRPIDHREYIDRASNYELDLENFENL